MAAEKTFQEWWARYSYRFEPGRILENSARTCWNDAAKLSEDSKTSTNTASPKLPTFEELSSIIGIKNRLKDSNHQKCFIAGAHAMYTLIGGQLRA
jgi:hypothetical protein